MEHIGQFYVGDTVTSMQKTSLVPGANDCLVYTTISGTIGMLVPFVSRDVSCSFLFFAQEQLKKSLTSSFLSVFLFLRFSFIKFSEPKCSLLYTELCDAARNHFYIEMTPYCKIWRRRRLKHCNDCIELEGSVVPPSLYYVECLCIS